VKFEDFDGLSVGQAFIDLHKTQLTGYEINKIIDNPHYLCRYCAPAERRELFPWKTRSRENAELSDYIIED
jgi:hypothetical protein